MRANGKGYKNGDVHIRQRQLCFDVLMFLVLGGILVVDFFFYSRKQKIGQA